MKPKDPEQAEEEDFLDFDWYYKCESAEGGWLPVPQGWEVEKIEDHNEDPFV